MTKLDHLNILLKDPSLKLPEFRSEVNTSGKNMPWLKKAVSKNAYASAELLSLLHTPMNELLQEVN